MRNFKRSHYRFVIKGYRADGTNLWYAYSTRKAAERARDNYIAEGGKCKIYVRNRKG